MFHRPLTVLFGRNSYIACADCGVAIPRGSFAGHLCDRTRTRGAPAPSQAAIDRFEDDWQAWLETDEGRVAVAAARARRS